MGYHITCDGEFRKKKEEEKEWAGGGGGLLGILRLHVISDNLSLGKEFVTNGPRGEGLASHVVLLNLTRGLLCNLLRGSN